ncbi:2-hydroxyacid dehydrogenase [Pseudoalteromonas mariniglutinosa]|uniref:2-hydroxyacid dehydrogenase n=1 Tax=Pseudoalteromonas mariniglutinosa TaxID=206042 RepID=UPI0038500759
MILLVAITGRDCTQLIAQLQTLLPDIDVQLWSECDDYNRVQFVLAWHAPNELWGKLPNLKVVSSFGAGIDSIDLAALDSDVQVVRIVDKQLAEDMAEYVLGHVLAHKLRLREYFYKQAEQYWQPKRAYGHKHVGILGFGELGKACAKRLLNNNFLVSAWSASNKHHESVNCYHGKHGLAKMLPTIDYLVCLLPLNTTTHGIINAPLLDKLPQHAVFINVARGNHVVEADLLTALDNDRLRGATLDVCVQEPLPKKHIFWHHEKITLTPHCAAISDLNSVTAQIADNAKRLVLGKSLRNKVDRTKGY